MRKLLKNDAIVLSLTTGLALLILVLIFGRVLAHPNQYLYSAEGDAVKSYYNFAYYLRYDEGIRHDGINYPYGDHLQYINSHPLYLQMIRFIDRHIYPVATYGVGILNLTMILSLLLAVPFLYLILRKFKVPPLFSAFVALVILFLTPQFDRIGGHFEMVYAFFIPLYWYLLIRWQEGRQRVLWGSLMLLTALVGGFTSAYYSALLMLLPFAVFLVEIWNNRKNLKAYIRPGLSLLFIALLPMIVVKTTVSLTDWVHDRPDNPWGFFIFHSNFFSIFLPQKSMLPDLTNNWSALKYQWEGRAYVGFPALLTALAFAISLGYSLIKWKKPEWRCFFPDKALNTYLFAAILVLLFSMGIPFNWHMEFLTELLPPLKQFRCLGRFSWIFYYVFTVYTAAFLYRFYRRARYTGFGQAALILVIFALGYWSLEAGLNAKKSTRRIFNSNHLLERTDDELLARFSSLENGPEQFQAILFLPYANTCGDKMLFSRGMEAFSLAMSCSYHTGLPIIESFSPRLSFSQAMSSIQLLADSTIYKTRVDDMNDKPVLLVIANEELFAPEDKLADKATVFYSDEAVTYASLPVNAFNSDHNDWLKLAGAAAESLPCYGELCTNADTAKIIYRDFETETSAESFTGIGSRYLKKGSFDLLKEPLYNIFEGDTVELSYWLYVDHRTDNMPELELSILDPSEKELKRERIDTRTIHNSDGLWVRVSKTFVPEPGMIYRFRVKGKYITIDDLLVRPASVDVLIKKEGKAVLFNNFRIDAAEQK